MEKSILELHYVCNHILRTTHAQVRQYQIGEKNRLELLNYYGEEIKEDAVNADEKFAQEILRAGRKDYPVIYVEEYPVHYAVIYHLSTCLIIGPINVEHQQIYREGLTVQNYYARQHKIEGLKIPYCSYETFCQEILLLFYMLTGREMSYQELNEKNFITDDLLASMKKKKSKLFFNYHEYSRVHNPYSQEARTMEGIRKGDVERVKKCISETFVGEYGVLSKNALQNVRNLGIVGMALASRAAIEGGMPYEEAFSLNDSQILKLEEINNIGEVVVMIRRGSIQYAEIVRDLRNDSNKKKNPLIEECKNLIFRKMHSKIAVRELADELDVSIEYLSALFRKTEGICIKDYIMNQKMQLAENLLIYSEYSIEQIGLYLGFSSQSHFGAMFKKYENMTPKQYRNIYAKKEFQETTKNLTNTIKS